MIDPKSLRIGNKLRIGIRGIVITVAELYESEFKTPEEGFICYSHPALSGIPLSEQEIIRLGLKHNSDKSIFEITKSSNWDDFTVRSYTENVWTLWYGDAPCLDMTIEYVHELQNLYYYFNREELTYKNETVKQ